MTPDPQTTDWRPLKEIKEQHEQFWVIVQPTHEPEIIGRGEEPNQFFCMSGIFSGLSNLDECLALPIVKPESPHARQI